MRTLRIALATARLTRFATTDDLGGWLFRDAAFEWAHGKERDHRKALSAWVTRFKNSQKSPMPESAERTYQRNIDRLVADDPLSWQARLVSGLDCPYCVGFWIGGAVLLTDRALPEEGLRRALFDLGLDALALNYVTAKMETLG